MAFDAGSNVRHRGSLAVSSEDERRSRDELVSDSTSNCSRGLSQEMSCDWLVQTKKSPMGNANKLILSANHIIS